MFRTKDFVRQTYLDNEWINIDKLEYHYIDDNLDFSYFFRYHWDDDINDWGPAANRITQTFDSLISVLIVEYFTGTEWLPSEKEVVVFNENQQITNKNLFNWNTNLQNWKVHHIVEYSYNPDWSTAQIKQFLLHPNPQILFQYKQTDYDYAFYPVNTTAPALQAKVSLSPNPVADFARIKVENPENQPVTFAFFDAGGRLLQQWTTRQENSTLHMAAYSPGAYYLRVMREGAVKTLPFIKH